MAPDTPAGPGDADNADRTRRRLRGFPGARVRDALDAFRRCVCRRVAVDSVPNIPQGCRRNQKAFTCQGLKKGLFNRRDPVHLPDQLGTYAR